MLLLGLFLATALAAEGQVPFRPIADAPATAQEGQDLAVMFDTARAASASVPPGPDAGYQRRQITIELQAELESFVASHTNSAWVPGARVWLARRSQLRSGYSQAMAHFGEAWMAARDVKSIPARQIAGEALGGLGMSLALAGRLSELDALEEEAFQLRVAPVGTEWEAALEIRAWARKHPTRAYTCGLYCLAELGRLTQPGQFDASGVVNLESPGNGFTAADLVQIAAWAGLRLHAALLNNPTILPVPSIVHLTSEHFIVVREQRGNFYGVYDRAGAGTRWLTAQEIAQEASGCVIVSDAVAPVGGAQATPLTAGQAAVYRGRYIGGPGSHEDSPCDSCSTCPLPLRRQPPPAPPPSSPPSAPPSAPPSSCANCARITAGMPTWFVSEPFLDLWLEDTPLHYESAYGPSVTLQLAYNPRHAASAVSREYWHGAHFGNYGGRQGLWACSWMSFAELDNSDLMVDLLLPQGGWATFTFSSASATVSDMNYRQNAWLERAGASGNYTSLTLHQPDGSGATYALRDDRSDPSGYRVYYRTDAFDPTGDKTTFAYNTNFTDYYGLTNVTAADGTSFTLQLDNQYAPNLPATVTNITSSYGASVSFRYTVPDYLTVGLNLTNITDAAGISSGIGYASAFGLAPNQLVTPYGTTTFSALNATTLFDRSVRITNAVGQQEFYGLIANYTGTDWPAYAASQIPTNTPVGTLDSSERTNRNSFYWNAQQFAAYAYLDVDAFNWTNFNSARIRHWLQSADASVDYTLSVEQQPSPSNWTNVQGQLTWFDYPGKPTTNSWRGTQIQPTVIARVMPDGSTSYQYFERLTNGLPTKAVDKWQSGGSAQYRTNTYLYAANNVDLVASTNALYVRVSSNLFNAYHQVVTNYDALSQLTVYQYDGARHQLTNVIRPTGLTTSYTYDGNHRLQQTTDSPINATRSFTWYSDGNLKSVTDERGLTVTNYWDGLNRLTGTKHPDGTTTTNLYSVATAYASSTGGTNILDLTATKDRLGYWTYFGYDALRRVTAETNANGAVTRYGYCDCGATSYVTNAWNTSIQFVTQYDYDFQGNRIYTYLPDATITNWFDALGRTIETCDAWGCRWFYYDNLSRLTNASNAVGTEQNTTYDLENRPLYVQDANGVTITNTYDDLGRLRTRTYPDGGVERFGYSARGLTAYTNQLDKITYYGYDEALRKTAETNANNEVLLYTNNAAGDLLSLTDGKSQTTKWNYDEYGRVTNKLDQASVEILRYKYDPDSRLTNRWSAAKTNTYYRYDPVGNLTNIDYPVSPDISFAYDALNRVTSMVDAAGTTAYGYAAGGQLWTEDGPFASDTVTNYYFNRLRTNLSLAQPTGVWTNRFVYDAAKRLTNVTSPAGSFAYLYPASSGQHLVSRLSLPNTSYLTNTFDTVARLTGTWLKNSTNGTLNSHAYTYNAGNQRTRQTFTDASTYDYYYDGIGQLTNADSSVAAQDRKYVYDAAWNLNYRTNNTTLNTFKVDGKNQLTNATPVGTQTYDGNGNVTFSAGTVQGYAYDDENELVNWYYYDGGVNGNGSPTSPADLRTELVYDGRGRLRKRIEYDVSADAWHVVSETRYVYDGMRVIQERDGNNTPTVSYTRGTDLSGSLEAAGGIGGLLARSHAYQSGSGNWTNHNCYAADGNGNVTYLLTSSQGLGASYKYDPYGNLITSSGTLATANVYRFSSKEWHANSGLVYYGYRWYSQNVQRWLNRDPIGEYGGINLYAYVHNRPAGTIDPFGWSDFNAPPGTVTGPSPLLPGPGQVPPGYNPSWPIGTDPRGPYIQDPSTGRKYWPDPENPRQWPHYDWKDPNGNTGHYPEKCDKPWPTQKVPPYDYQSPKNPWPEPLRPDPWWYIPFWRWPMLIPVWESPGWWQRSREPVVA